MMKLNQGLDDEELEELDDFLADESIEERSMDVSRIAYEVFLYSHASIMHNALRIPQLERIESVGIRDFCQQENEIFLAAKDRVRIVRSADMRAMQYAGATWKDQCDAIINALPEKVHISFDIDGLDPTLCPHTGTPVPGGLDFHEAVFVLRALARSGRTIVGFDLNEVAPGQDDEWDGNVGARMLYKLIGFTLASQGRARCRPRRHRA